MEEQERKNRRIGLLTSGGIHAALFLALFFMIAWRAPDPPLPEYGIELNFGLDAAGSGDVQPEEPVGSESEEVKDVSQEVPAEEVPTEQEEESTETNTKEAEVPPVSKVESPVVVKEEKKEPARPAPTEQKKEEVKNTYEPKKETPKEPVADAKKGEPGSQGDNKDKTGDKGSPEGKLDANALYGTPGGGGGGTGLSLVGMTGWAWADKPALPELPDNENGRIIFEIECDDNGDIVGIKTVERTLSPKAEQLLRDEIRKNSLVRTSDGKVPERSKGRIVFVLRTK